ncbi:MAG: hypothetical protein GY699_20795, partial [Desulfobacteraceae bacterium]|nr:hypothetical protein [Desulfobacteraceae bacterium]
MGIKSETGARPHMWRIMFLVMVVVILFLGLRPKGLGIENNVKWLPARKALEFNKNSIAFMQKFKGFEDINKNGQITIEIMMRAGSVDKNGFNILLMLHGGSDRHQLVLGQWGTSLVVMNGDDYNNRRRLPRIFVKDAFSITKKHLITITSSEKGTKIYIDGMLSGQKKNLQLTVQDKRDQHLLVLGNSIYNKASWIGEIYGLAIYGKAFSKQDMDLNAKGRVFEEQFNSFGRHKPLLLFTFRENQNGLVPDESGKNQPLTIPSRPIVLKKK